MAIIAVVGGSGFIGRHVAAALVEAGQIVTVFAHDDFDIVREDAAQMATKLLGGEVVGNCAGIARDGRLESLGGVNAEGARRLAAACGAANVRRLVHVSALGADANDATRFQRSKGEGEKAIRGVEGLETVIVRPSLVLGAGGASGDFFAALAALPVPPRLSRGEWRVQPLHVSELAELVTRLALDPAPPASIDAVGPRVITTDQLTTALRAWLGLRPAPALALPRGFLNFFAWVNEVVEMGPGDREFVDLLERGNVSDPAAITAALGRAPLSFAESLERRPATIADLWRARLYFLQPLLRLTLAILWIGTGLVSFGLYPPSEFFVMLGELNLTGPVAEIALFGAAAFNCVLGVLLLVNWRTALVAQAMLVLLILFSVFALMLPHEYWLTPFAPILKNAPIAVALLTLIALEPPLRAKKTATAAPAALAAQASSQRARFV